MNVYSFLSVIYDLIDKVWFADKGRNPRMVIEQLIPDDHCMVLDMCCGTFSNGLPIACKNPDNKVVGIDRSRAMLREAKRKVNKAGLRNVRLLCRDALNTGFREETFDYIVIGLVLHECNEGFWKNLLAETHRLLKHDGKLVVLEWDKQSQPGRKVKFAVLYAMEFLGNPRYFKKFYYSDKTKFFEKYQFKMLEKHECNYSSVMVLEKD